MTKINKVVKAVSTYRYFISGAMLFLAGGCIIGYANRLLYRQGYSDGLHAVTDAITGIFDNVDVEVEEV